MVEPLTLGVAELSARWNLTLRQLLQHALGPGVPLYFSFEGLAFDIADHWHRANGDWIERREFTALEASINAAEAQLRRRARGQLSEWDSLTTEEAVELRARIDTNKDERDRLAARLDQREEERNRCDFRGYMRAAPSTLWDIDRLGSAPFPHKAFHPLGAVKVATLSDGRGHDGKQIWEGRLMALEPMTGHDQYPNTRLTVDDLCASLAEIKAIEAYEAKNVSAVADSDASEPAQVPVQRPAAQEEAGASSVPPMKSRTHRLARDLLAPVIDRVRAALADPWDAAAVMAELEKLARLPDKDRPAPLAGVTSGGIKWRDGGTVRTLTRKSLGDRLRRLVRRLEPRVEAVR